MSSDSPPESDPEDSEVPEETPQPPSSEKGQVDDEYRMENGQRPDDIKRRNRITGLVLLLLIALFVGIAVYSRAVGW